MVQTQFSVFCMLAEYGSTTGERIHKTDLYGIGGITAGVPTTVVAAATKPIIAFFIFTPKLSCLLCFARV